MSEKPVVHAQECAPSVLGIAKKPRPALKRKPQTEVVVQMGPFTDGQITSPELMRPLEGPTEWLIKPKTGEIVPFDSSTPPGKDVIRKFITVGAQDNDVPEGLPKLSEGYVVERVSQDPLPSMDGKSHDNSTNTVRIIEREGPASVECKEMPPPNTTPPTGETEEPTPVDPPDCPPVDKPNECETPIDAVNDNARTQVDCPIAIDVLKNDMGCGELEISGASAENGSIEIKDGLLLYTPNEGFCGEDVITYTIGDKNSLTDTAQVFIDVEAGYGPNTPSDCDKIASVENQPEYPTDYTTDGNTSNVFDQEHSSANYSADYIIEGAQDKLQSFLDQVNEHTHSQTHWGTSFTNNGFDYSSSAPTDEAATVC